MATATITLLDGRKNVFIVWNAIIKNGRPASLMKERRSRVLQRFLRDTALTSRQERRQNQPALHFLYTLFTANIDTAQAALYQNSA